MADVGDKSCGISFSQCPLARSQRSFGLASLAAAQNPRRMARRGDFRRPSGVRGYGGLGFRAEEYSGTGFLPAESALLFAFGAGASKIGIKVVRRQCPHFLLVFVIHLSAGFIE